MLTLNFLLNPYLTQPHSPGRQGDVMHDPVRTPPILQAGDSARRRAADIRREAKPHQHAREPVALSVLP